MNLRMKMPVGWMYRGARVDRNGQKLWGQVAVLSCWLDQDGEVTIVVTLFRIRISHKPYKARIISFCPYILQNTLLAL
jgi:hypothetical protein